MSHPTPLLEVRSLMRRSRDGTLLLEDVSFQVRAGERWGITGPTGAGKSLLLRAVALIDPVDSGAVLWNGSEIANHDVPAYRSRVIYLHQKAALLAGTVESNLQAPFSLQQHRGRTFDRDFVVAALERLDLGAPFLDKQSSDLSGGESQIAALLRAVQLRPTILLLDEPTSALDAESVSRIEQLVQDWLAQAPHESALAWVSHDPQQIQRMTDQTLELRRGRVQETAGAA